MYQVTELYKARMYHPARREFYIWHINHEKLSKMKTKQLRDYILNYWNVGNTKQLRQTIEVAKCCKFRSKSDCVDAYWACCCGIAM
jgi:hypothetical protein